MRWDSLPLTGVHPLPKCSKYIASESHTTGHSRWGYICPQDHQQACSNDKTILKCQGSATDWVAPESLPDSSTSSAIQANLNAGPEMLSDCNDIRHAPIAELARPSAASTSSDQLEW